MYCAQTGDCLWPDPIELSRPSPANGSAKGTAAKACPVRRPESSGTAIPLDLPFRLLVGSYVVSRMWAVPALERPSTDLPTGLLPPSRLTDPLRVGLNQLQQKRNVLWIGGFK